MKEEALVLPESTFLSGDLVSCLTQLLCVRNVRPKDGVYSYVTSDPLGVNRHNPEYQINFISSDLFEHLMGLSLVELKILQAKIRIYTQEDLKPKSFDQRLSFVKTIKYEYVLRNRGEILSAVSIALALKIILTSNWEQYKSSTNSIPDVHDNFLEGLSWACQILSYDDIFNALVQKNLINEEDKEKYFQALGDLQFLLWRKKFDEFFIGIKEKTSQINSFVPIPGEVSRVHTDYIPLFLENFDRFLVFVSEQLKDNKILPAHEFFNNLKKRYEQIFDQSSNHYQGMIELIDLTLKKLNLPANEQDKQINPLGNPEVIQARRDRFNI